jgi:hypothetical protein
MTVIVLEAAGYEPITLNDMGCGSLIFSQDNEVSGRRESLAVDWTQLMQAVEALRPRYGDEAKNTDQTMPEPAVLEI